MPMPDTFKFNEYSVQNDNGLSVLLKGEKVSNPEQGRRINRGVAASSAGRYHDKAEPIEDYYRVHATYLKLYQRPTIPFKLICE